MEKQSTQPALVTLTDPRSAVSEAYRTLRTNLEFTAMSSALRALVVTTPGAGEGKSTTLANLAVTMAQGGRTVILVDADLRRPAQHTIFGSANERGLSTTLLDDAGIQNPPLLDTSVPGLRLLPAGPTPPNPAELLASPRMLQLIETLKDMADLVLFDAPPVVPVTDAAILGARTDGVLLVLQAGKSKREHAARARTLLEQVGARIIGTALTNARVDSELGGY
ncbi:MAG: CpsD/CapB family tyrosine-protein kinase [Ardenticatenales bacterium]|nr:CpsD/CapB family tyrosine-protein kinase [Ardenticatenales bacterium]